MPLPIPEFKVLLYGPGLHPAGVRARARFEDGRLAVLAQHGSCSVPPDILLLRAGGFDGRQWLLTWPAAEGTYSAMLQGDDALEAFIHLAPPEMKGQLREARKQLRGLHRRFRFGATIVALLLALPLLALGLFWLNADRLGQWAVSRIDLQQERRLGDAALAQLRGSGRWLESGVAFDAIQRIGSRLTEESVQTYRFHVAVNPEINAYALPGGHIVVNTGLIQAAESAQEAAGVLAHEIAHVEGRHSLRGMIHQLGWRAVLAVALGDLGVWGDLATELGRLRYSREMESEADREALVILQRAGVAPHGLEIFLARLAARKSDTLAMLSSHPADEQRLADLRAAILGLDASGYYPLGVDWEAARMDL